MDIADLERKLGIDGISAEQQMEIITALQQSAAEKIAKAKSELKIVEAAAYSIPIICSAFR